MSFLDQLRSQAKALQSQQGQLQLNLEENTAKTEAACRCALPFTETRGNVVVTPDHDNAMLAFRILNARGFEILNTTWPAAMIKGEVLDELAKLIACEPNRFV